MAERRKRCMGTTKKGAPCKMTLDLQMTPDGLRCPLHDPKRAEERRRRSSLGGKRSKRTKRIRPEDVPALPQSMQDAQAYMAWIADNLAHGRLTDNRAKALTASIRGFMQAVSLAELESQVRELRAQLKKLKRSGK